MTSLDERYEPIAVQDRDDIGSNNSANVPLIEITQTCPSRRGLLKGLMASTAAVAASGALPKMVGAAAADEAAKGPSTLTFTQTPHEIGERHQVAPGYNADILIRWGDKVVEGAPPFDPLHQTGAAQEKQFGYNCDYIGYQPLPLGSNSSDHGLLGINHEYTSPELMFANWYGPPEAGKTEPSERGTTPEETQVELAAHGHAIIEVKKEQGVWRVVENSP
jgi:secreted PhoX family phosphatase